MLRRRVGRANDCALISIGRQCKDDFSWTYSLGIYDTCGQPELIAIGLPFEVAKACLNEAARRMHSGVDLTSARQRSRRSIVNFGSGHLNGSSALMNFANWYNGSSEYPVLQIIYPDLQNRFQ